MRGKPIWLSTEEAGASVGMTGEWVRRQIIAGRLRATAFETGHRRTYRIHSNDWSAFLTHWSRLTDDPEWFAMGLGGESVSRGDVD